MTTRPTNRSIRTEQMPPDDPAQCARCRRCGAAHRAEERFCESCGYDHTARATWSVEIIADLEQYEHAASDLPFPTGRVPRVLVFEVDEITLGRRNDSRHVHPDIDLSGALADPGVSHTHACLSRDAATGAFAITDLGSTNGTRINDDDEPIAPHQPVPLKPGDRVRVGAWTTLELTA
jgi:ribosomal protein L37E